MKFTNHIKPIELNGKTIHTCEVIKAEFGRTNYSYTLMKFTDGTRHLFGCRFGYPNPKPSLEEMKQAPNFFTIDEIVDRTRELEIKRRRDIENNKENKRQQYLRLKEELGE